jgi:hypothetical protein
VKLRSPLQTFGALAIAAALVWGTGMIAAALPQAERLRAEVHRAAVVDYATDVVGPGSRFIRTGPTYDQ